tara:strand:- start:97770 stop:98696 length:927 start_codon:yes stop_codon:yes gene_type:complete
MMYPRKTYHTVFFGFLFVAIFGFALPVLAEQSGTDPAENGSDDSRTKTEENFFFSDDAPEPDSPVMDNAFENPDEPVHEPGQWEDPEIPSTFPELQILDELSQKKSLERMKKARSLYKTAGDLMREAGMEFEESKKKIEKLPAQYEWQQQEKEARLEREKRQVFSKYRNQAVSYLIESMKQLDKVANPEIKKSEPFLNLKGAAIREYVKLQFQNGNPGMTISVLEEYLALKEEHAREPEPYRLLAIAYRTQEASAKEMGREDVYRAMKARKNDNILKYAELKFGKDSYEYKRLKIQVDRTTVQPVSVP